MTLPAAADEVIATAERLWERARRMTVLLREIADWADTDRTVYDPVADRYAIQLPGDVVRRARELTR